MCDYIPQDSDDYVPTTFQSPIDIPGGGFVKREVAPLLDEIKGHITFEIEPRGTNFHANVVGGSYVSTLFTKNTRFQLKQLHMHAPSENHLQGNEYDLEIHFVHTAGDHLCVFAVFFEIDSTSNSAGTQNDNTLGKVIEAMKAKRANPQEHVEVDIIVTDLFGDPDRRDLLKFSGSLTTPPYTEGVLWVVSKKILKAKASEIEDFKKLVGKRNDRPIQPLNMRTIFSFE